MKRLTTLAMIVLLVAISSSADEISLFAGSAFTYNEVLGGLYDSSFTIKYNTENGTFYFVTKDFMHTGFIYLNETNIETFRANIEKYLEWETLAVESQVTLKKQLPDSTITGQVGFWFGDDWYMANDFELYFSFFSQNVDRHQFIIKSNKVKSRTNEFVDYKLETLYLDKDQVLLFKEGITEEAFSAKFEEYEKQKGVESMFN